MHQPDLNFAPRKADARAMRDDGIARAETHADAETPAWSTRAREFARAYAERHAIFTAEDVRAAADAAGFPLPPDARAWGGAFTALRRSAAIEPDGFVEAANPHAHCCPKRRWRSRIVQADGGVMDGTNRTTSGWIGQP